MAPNTKKCLLILVFVLFITLSISTFVFRGFTYPFQISNCEMQKVASLLQCANFCGQGAGVTFFFNPSEMMCRWKCLTTNAIGSLTNGWNRYELYSNGNVALSKSASSSSVLNYEYPYGPHLAVDGILDHGVYHGGPGCFTTYQEAQPYLQIHLGREYRIIFLRMFNRMDCCGERLHDVNLLTSPVGGQFMVCGFYKGPGKTREIVDIPCEEGTVGQIIKVQITRGTLNILQLCEVEIYTL